VLANRLPYPIDDGWKARTYHVIRGLARRSRVTLVVFDASSPARQAAFMAEVGGAVEIVQVRPPRSHSPLRLLLGLITSTPLYVWNMRTREYARVLRRLVAERRPDVIVAELAGMYAYLLDLPSGPRRVIDTHNVDSVVLRRYSTALRNPFRRMYAAVTVRKLEQLERRIFADADLVWVCSDHEIDAVRAIHPSARAVAVPNGVDTGSLSPLTGVAPHPARLLFFGRLDYQPNRDALHYLADEILPIFRREAVSVTVDVVGAGVDAGLKAVAQTNPEIRLVGRVTDIRESIAHAAVVIVPLRMGGGTRLKILEALSMGKAVVSTTIGAEGLDVTSGHDIVLADTPADFVTAVVTLLADPVARDRLGARGRETAVQHYDWTRVEDTMARQLGWEPLPAG
jgi:polysaccharide biosynthesis protein PslH